MGNWSTRHLDPDERRTRLELRRALIAQWADRWDNAAAAARSRNMPPFMLMRMDGITRPQFPFEIYDLVQWFHLLESWEDEWGRQPECQDFAAEYEAWAAATREHAEAAREALAARERYEASITPSDLERMAMMGRA